MHCVIRLLLAMLLLSAAGSATADLVASPWQLDFEYQSVQTTSAPRATTLKNTGAQALTVVAIATLLPPNPVFARAGGSCGDVPFTLAPQATCTIAHTFMPASISIYTQTIRMTLAGGEIVDFGLIGEGDVGRLDISPMTLSFSPTLSARSGRN